MLLVVILLGETVPLLETVFVDPECLSPILNPDIFPSWIQDLGSWIKLKREGKKFKKYPPVQHKKPKQKVAINCTKLKLLNFLRGRKKDSS
jgi:hypothetical protein